MMRHIAVIDIGKTNAKVALVDAADLSEIDVRRRPNTVLTGLPYPHFDIDGIWIFILEALGHLHRDHGVDVISVTAHGASIVLLDKAGALASPMLDYEHAGPDTLSKAYDAIRPSFAETGSPRLPGGLNVGAQLFWLLDRDPSLRERVAQIVTYPQYWSGRLTGHSRCEFTSLGCHTDLWNPWTAEFSALVDRLELRGKMAPLGRADDCLGPILPDIAHETGLPKQTMVYSGIHDSNASLLPHLMSQAAPFSVVSTGTWVICMAVGGAAVTLDPAKDALVNVNANANPTPSARFMGGREYELMSSGAVSSAKDVRDVLDHAQVLLPAIESGSGPFAGLRGGWSDPDMSKAQQSVALSFYLALMTAECLALIGAQGGILVEGPFSRNRLFLDMLGAVTARRIRTTDAETGTSAGAALLTDASITMPITKDHVVSADTVSAMRNYARVWQTKVHKLALTKSGLPEHE